jgi:hypothetical protein
MEREASKASQSKRGRQAVLFGLDVVAARFGWARAAASVAVAAKMISCLFRHLGKMEEIAQIIYFCYLSCIKYLFFLYFARNTYFTCYLSVAQRFKSSIRMLSSKYNNLGPQSAMTWHSGVNLVNFQTFQKILKKSNILNNVI